MRPRAGALPTFIVIGAAKSGTTALHEYLALHPEISMSEPKELNFFVEDWNWEKGLAWYRRHFDASRPARGESSPSYTVHPRRGGVPERIAGIIPDAKLIYIVRDPIARIASSYTNRLGLRCRTRSPDKAFQPDSRHVVASRYMYQLDQYLSHFSQERILVLDSRDLLQRRADTLRNVFAFVAVDAAFRHPDHAERFNVTKGKRRVTVVGARVRKGIKGTPLDTRLVRNAISGLERFAPREPVRSVRVLEAFAPATVDVLREDAARLRAFTGMAFDHWTV